MRDVCWNETIKLPLAAVSQSERQPLSSAPMRITILTSLLLVGCLKPQPPAPPPVIVVEIRPIPIPRTYGTITAVEILEDQNEPPHTWMTGDEAKKAVESRKECHCHQGDPMCECIE